MLHKGKQAKKQGAPAQTQAGLKAAQMLAMQGRESEAEETLKSVLRADPSCAIALYQLGVFAAKREDNDTAEDYFKKAQKLAPRAPDIILAIALLRLEQGRHDEAATLAGEAAALSAAPETLTRIGNLYREAGAMDKAQECFERALQAKPGYIHALYGLRPIVKFTAQDAAFKQLQELDARKNNLPPPERILLAFTLGKALMDAGQEDEAFAQYEAGNRLKRKTLGGFDVSLFEEYADNITRLFTKDIVEKFAGRDAEAGKHAVFVVGMPRSGSTLVDQIISSHPQATSIGEAKTLGKCIPCFPHAEISGLFAPGQPSITQAFIDSLSIEMLDGIAKDYARQTLPHAKGAKAVVDKMLFNYLWAGVIRLAMPGAKIIHCTRDPADIGLSLWQICFPSGMQWTYDQTDIARYYRAYNKVMAHWEALFPGDIYIANYEKMVAGQEEETRKLLDFCGLPWDDACLSFHESKNRVQTASAAQVRRPIYKSSVAKWKKHEKHLTELVKALEDGDEQA